MTTEVNLPTSGRSFPATSTDTEFFWAGTRSKKILIQRCADCASLRHPPGPTCPACHSFDWNTVESSGRGTLYSYVVQHHPRAPGFDGPAVIVLVELSEGIRVVANLDADPSTLVIGEPLEARFIDQAEGWTALAFVRPTDITTPPSTKSREGRTS